jgi:predicted ribosome quality control (RQC) complex YloA/Tae2 family protein
MFFDALTMACVADELRDATLGGRVQQVLLPDALSVGLEIYAQRQRHYLLASAHAESGRVLLASEKLRRGVDKVMGLLLLLRKHVRGAILSAIEQPPAERVLRLEFNHPEWGCSDLMVEIMGRHSNLILVGAGGLILDAAKRVGPHMSASRPILPGQPYLPPPPQAKLAPSELTEYRLRQILGATEAGTQVWQALVGGLRGMSPLLAREITFRALGQARATVGRVERLTPLLEATRELLASLDSGDWQPSVVLDAGQPVVYAPYPPTHRGEPVGMPSMSQAIEMYVSATSRRPVTQDLEPPPGVDAYAAARRPLYEAIAAASARLERRRLAVQRPLREAAEADHWRRCGEWILAKAHTITPRQVELVAETGDGEILIVPLDPAKTAADNAQGYFARYRKAQRAAEGGPARLREVELAQRDLDQLQADLLLAADRSEIDAVRETLVEAGIMRATGARRPRATASKPLSVISPDGFAILVGRNSRQNDRLTFRQADGQDWWFHARGAHGAHVVVRSGGAKIPPGTIQRAAELAAHFSTQRSERKVAVDYTQRRYVRRIPHAAPGLVTYSHEQTIRVPPRGP